MKRITVEASVRYDVLIGSGLLKETGRLCKSVDLGQKVMVITDDNVMPLYFDTVKTQLETSGYEVFSFMITNGEGSKSTDNHIKIVNCLAQNHFSREDTLIALGGGVVGDLCGFCAATYLRGIRFVQIPTTLLAAVDSSVGGKTAVNLQAGKNLLGAFWQPSLVICDPDCLKTLPKQILADGFAEVIKYGAIWDLQLFKMVENGNFDIDSVIARCVEIKRDIVGKDEFDNGLRQVLNFGHTIGHAIEACSNFEISHGSAVAIGMVIVERAFYKQGVCDIDCVNRLEEILKKFSLPVSCKFSADEISSVALGDKKCGNEDIKLVAVEQIGSCEIRKLRLESLKSFIESGLER
ncbi:MAG: 3-dehydroquinate synthase [bacterium]|nr:3-dehydroquinate synthase [bacterium]